MPGLTRAAVCNDPGRRGEIDCGDPRPGSDGEPPRGSAADHAMSSRLSAGRDGPRPLHVLVTGGCGFIGSAVVRHLVRSGRAEVLDIDKLTYAGDLASVSEAAGSPRYRLCIADVCDGKTVGEEFESFQPDWVIHLAAESHVDRSIDAPAAFVQTNVVGTFTLLEAALRYRQQLPDARKPSQVPARIYR
jgi:NAD(P)-dependent dehydrogenase (short-subunit alcohol dehydrogenase family)